MRKPTCQPRCPRHAHATAGRTCTSSPVCCATPHSSGPEPESCAHALYPAPALLPCCSHTPKCTRSSSACWLCATLSSPTGPPTRRASDTRRSPPTRCAWSDQVPGCIAISMTHQLAITGGARVDWHEHQAGVLQLQTRPCCSTSLATLASGACTVLRAWCAAAVVRCWMSMWSTR